MRCVDADKLYPDCMTKNGELAISQSQLANAPTIECCYNCKNYTEDCLKRNCDKCNKYEKDNKAN